MVFTFSRRVQGRAQWYKGSYQARNGKSLSLGTSVISITTSKAIPLNLSKRFSKPYVELNNNHWLNLNHGVAGDLKLKLNGSLKPTIFNLEENSNHEMLVV